MLGEQWMVRKDNAPIGPFTTEALRSEIEVGRISRTAMVSLDGAAYRPVIEWPQLQGIRYKEPFNPKPQIMGAISIALVLGLVYGVQWFMNRPKPPPRDTTFDAMHALARTWPDASRKGSLAGAREAYALGDAAACEALAAGAMVDAQTAEIAALFAECAAVANRGGLQGHREKLLASLPESFDVERAALLVSLRRNAEALPIAMAAYAKDPKRARTRLVLAKLAIEGAQTPEAAPVLLEPLQPNVEALALLQQWALASGELAAPFLVKGAPEASLLAYAGKVCRLDAVKAAAEARWKPVADALIGKRGDEAKAALGDKEDSIQWNSYAAIVALVQQHDAPFVYAPLSGFLEALVPQKKNKLESLRREELLATLDGIAAPNPCGIPFLEDVLTSLAADDAVLSELLLAWRGQKAKKRLPGFEGTLISAVGLFVQGDYKHTVGLLERASADEDAPRAMHALLGRAIERVEPAVSDDFWAKLAERDDDFTELVELHEARVLALSGKEDEAREHYRAIYLNDKTMAPLEVLRTLAVPKKETKQ